jgi:competence protein ComEC
MQNSYVYWRASHPLVFITLHFLLGIFIASAMPFPSSRGTALFSIVILLLELIVMILCSKGKLPMFTKGIYLSFCLISWGCLIQWNAFMGNPMHMPKAIQLFIDYCRNGLIYKINKTIISKEANGFALALLIGVKMDMNKALVNAYTQLGIIHIIAISGMHLDILFKTLSKLTGLLPPKKGLKLVEIIVLLWLVWTYTFMAGSGPSIIRASVFFSIYLLGKYFELSNFTLNAIAGGLLLLILVKANGLENISLQLSYAAVIGIHLFYKILYNAIDLDNPIIQFLWSNCCVSLAAQLTTFPILVLHFHQVAAWVLISNFIMVPLSNFILYGLALLLLLPMRLAIYGGSLVQKYILFFNQLVQDWFSNTKAGTVQITMSRLQVFLYYIILLLVYLWIYQKKSGYLIVIIALLTGYTFIKLFS